MTASQSDAELGRDEEAVRHFVEHLSMIYADWGFPRMAARVLISMMAADEDSLTAGELSERLGVSAAAISGAVRYLIQLGVLQRVPLPGSRRDSYRLPEDPWYTGSLTKTQIYRQIADIADEGVKVLGGPDTPSGHRMAEMRDFLRFLDDETDELLARWAARRASR